METIVHNVRDLTDQERTAAEQLVGHELQESQQLMIRITDAVGDGGAHNPNLGDAPWSSIYDGLSDERIAELDRAIRERADFRRTLK